MPSVAPRRRVALPLTGGCACGAVRYRLSSAPVLLFACHCSLCQRQSGSAFGLSLRVRRDDLALSGPVARFDRVTERGAPSESLFCPSCGGRILNARPSTEFFHLRGCTLDDTSWLRPAAHIWTEGRQDWVTLDPEALLHPRQPDDLQAMTALWQARMAPDFG
jgi:hypothetical protein